MPQIIPLVVTAITAVTSAVVAAGPWAVAAFNAANVIGAAALANEAFKAVQPQVKSSSTALEWNADPNAPNRFAFGRVGGAGNIIHNATYGPDKMFVGFVGVMSASGPIKSWQAFKADDAFVSFDGTGKAVNTEYANEMYLGVQRGLQPELFYLPSPAGLKNEAVMPRWGASYKLSGKAAYMYTLAENSKRSAFKGKVPTGIHYIEGLYCYDPRFDDTYPGGTGPCRIDDPKTWVYSTNAYIHALNWNIGRWEGEARGFTPPRYGVPYASMKVGGIGATPDGIDFSGYVEAANVFDENAWACSAWPDADQSKAAVLDSFLQAGGGIYAERQGKISCLHRAAPRTSVVTITADDTAGTIEYDTTTSLLERINTIRPEYWSEAHGWQMVATDEVTSSVWREEDGQGVAVTRSKGLAYNYVPQSKQARELAALQVAHTREGIRGTAPLRHYLDLEVGDCFTFEVPEAVLNGQKCIVLNVDPDLENDIIHVTFASESDGKYPFAFGQADAPPPAPALQPADNTVSPPLPGDWTIIPRPPSPGGVQVPIIDLSGIVSNATADAMLINWREVAAGEDPDAQPPFMDEDGELLPGWVDAGVWPPTTRTLSIQGPQPGAKIWIAVRYKRGNNVSPAELTGPINVGDLIAGGLSPDSPDWDTIRDLANGEAAAELIAEAEARQAAALATAKSQLQAADAATNAALSSADTRLTSGLNALSTALDDLALEDLDGFLDFSASIQNALDGKATNGQLSGLATRVTTAEGTLTAHNTRLNTVETDLAGKAGATDLANLTTRVTSAEGVNAAQNTRLNTVEADVAGKASAAALTDLSASVAVRNRTFYTATEPTNPYRGYPLVTGDEWINTSANNERKLWSGTQNQWLNSHDPRIASTAGQVVTLDARVTGHQTAISDLQTGKASASDLVALTTRVTSAEGVNTAQNSRLNTVESSLDGKASATEVNTLKSEVTAARNGSTSLNAQLTGMRQVSSDLQSGKANASDLAALSTRVTGAENDNAAQNIRLNTVESGLAGKASASSVTDLSASVAVRNRIFYTATEPTNPYRGYPLVTGDEWVNSAANNERRLWSNSLGQWLLSQDPRIASTAGQVTTLDAKVSGHQTAIADLQTGKASASDLTALTTRVTTAEGVNTAQNTRLNTVETSLDGKASSSSVAALSSEVAAARNGSPTLAAQLTSMRQTVVDGLAGKASTTALTTLSSRVGTAESTLTTVAQTAADASGIAKAIIGFFTDVNGKITGMKSENDGVMSLMEFMADVFRIVSADGSTEFTNGIWYTVSSGVRTSWGKVHGASGHGLVWWTGPNSVTRGSETKSNAYVYVSMNTTGGPRFGGTDVPTGGNTVIEGPVIRGQTRSFNSSNLTGGGWVSAGTVTLTEVPGGSNLSFQLVSLSGDISPGTTFAGEARILDGGSVVASTTFTLFPEVPGGPLTISGGLAVANVSGSGSKTYAVEVRNTGVASLNFPSGQWSLTTSTVATSSQAGMMSPQQAQQLAELWASGGGGGVALATTAPASVGVNNAVGTGTTAARADHVHAHGNQAGGGLHALATTSAHGFMPSTDKVKLNGIATGATANSPENAHASTGTLLQRDPSSGAARAQVFAANTGGSTVGGFTIGGRSLYANGDDLAFNRAVSALAFNPVCDLDLKENVQPVSDDLAALGQVLGAGQIEYDRTQDGAHALGFAAQALRDINPLWVVGGEPLDPDSPPEDLDLAIVDGDGVTLRKPLTVDSMALISSLFAAVRQNANDTGYAEMRLEQALNRIDALEAEMAALRAA